MKANYDFSKGFKNPHAGKFKDGFRVRIHYDSPDGGWDEETFVRWEDVPAEIAKDAQRYAEEDRKSRRRRNLANSAKALKLDIWKGVLIE
jgi:hypothetical protein